MRRERRSANDRNYVRTSNGGSLPVEYVYSACVVLAVACSYILGKDAWPAGYAELPPLFGI